ncbi:MAG: OsmC family protein [Cardiobacteriaceae bacterium]|nr:OsmC family protein [Cardiobacteriaceae bacterium]
MKTLSIAYTNHLNCQAKHTLSGTTLTTDAPLDNGGKGESFSPTDLVATALAACTLTMMAKKAESMGIPYNHPHIEAEKIMQTEPRRIGEIILNIHFSDTYDEKTRRILEATAHACPVAQSLHPDLKQTLHFHYPI